MGAQLGLDLTGLHAKAAQLDLVIDAAMVGEGPSGFQEARSPDLERRAAGSEEKGSGMNDLAVSSGLLR